ncbi:S-adenosyl-L-methionine-dependent methyltransferase [Parachaetomium inaequale]|uniref:tRNA (adenine(58)-N(1))-methyltransferase catalytic subunit TRM61 n=1 Tax=Parachaetomium inaequale TaxID=2588326 RepID=A0AAN6PJA8_9PEZI|nr:S-adenosyl-L-methionine-dependent methyltransferase [Parachaetomium inaequale]
MTPTTRNISPFLDPGPRTKANSLAILQLSRDNLLPVYLQPPTGEHDGYAEGAVVNTRYGSFPHSTMLNVPWGSQIRASKVDTGSRGRKRKREGVDDACREATGAAEKENEDSPAATNEDSATAVKKAVADASGFIHILPPTPELWTTSLPHRTQVVYTPDYSYILHRIRARPGSVLIEAGAGSGSFTHASVRAVYNGYPAEGERKGKVFSFEFHEQRYHKMKKELSDHGMNRLVHLTHRDVYNGGFLVDGKSPEADAVFLDLPAPWEALHHLSRRRPQTPLNGNAAPTENDQTEWVSPLNPKKSVHLCTFSPCIEQVTRTVSAMRRLGWVDIDMVEIANRKLHTSRERVGLNLNFDRGVNNSARDVEEALTRLVDIESRFREHAAKPRDGDEDMDSADEDEPAVVKGDGPTNGGQAPSAEETAAETAPWMEGRLITRGEPEIKTHTSYLVFAVLPMDWTEEDEAAAAAKYPLGKEQKVIGAIDKVARKQERREALQKQQGAGNRKARRKERDTKMGEAAA